MSLPPAASSTDGNRTPTQVSQLQSRPRRPSGPPQSPTSPRSAKSPTLYNVVGSHITQEMPSSPVHLGQESLERRRTSKARDLLRKHYGLGGGPPAPSGNPNDPMDIGRSGSITLIFWALTILSDSPAFNAKAYYEQLITTSSLPVLLKRENELLTEIRELDSERQSLVYNHHHELIAASDTISAMKSRAESLESDLEKLKVAFSEISRLTAQISSEPAIGIANPSRNDSHDTTV